MTTVTSIPVGSTGQSLEGLEVNAAVRESVVLSDPETADAWARVVSTQPIDMYGLPIWVQGTPSVAIAGSLPVVSTFGLNNPSSTFVTNLLSSTFVLNPQSSTFVTNPQLTVTTVPSGVASTFAVNQLAQTSSFVVNFPNPASTVVVSSVPHALVGTSQVFGGVSTFPLGVSSTFAVNNPATVSTQIVSSIPFYVAQSSAPWTMNGGLAVTNVPTVNVTNVPAVNITSSIPFYVAQSSGPWSFIETYSTNAGALATSVVLIASLNTTVIKGARGNLYSYQVSNFASTSLYVKLANASTAATTIASTAPYLWRIGVAPSTTVHGTLDVPINFSTGITMITTRGAWNQDLTAPLGSTAVVNIEYF